jgi:hypothetical protein
VRTRTLFVLLLLLGAIGASLLLADERRELAATLEEREGTIADLRAGIEERDAALQRMGRELDEQKDTLRTLEADIQDRDGTIAELEEKLAYSKKGEYFIVGYSRQLDMGVATPLEVEIDHGSGRVLLDTVGIAVDKNAKTSMRTAYRVAERITGADLSEKDVVFTVINPFDFEAEMEGPSAGAAMCLLLISILEDRPIRDGYLITGRILWNGTIGHVGLIPQKFEAAQEANATVLMVPVGDAIPAEGLSVIEVATMEEVMEIALDS